MRIIKLRECIPLALLICASCASCASTPSEPPQWALRGVDAQYPPQEYIAQEGRAKTKQAAGAGALGALSHYFETEITVTARSTQSLVSGGTSLSTAQTASFVRTASKLFAVRYSAPYYDPYSKEYAVVAYINRGEAWNIFEPRARRAIERLRALYRTAESESAPLKAYFEYEAARRYARGAEFVSTLSFGETLHPENMKRLTGPARAEMDALGSKTEQARAMASIALECTKDFESKIAGTLTALLSAQGLTVTNNRKNASAVCEAAVDEGYQYREGTGHFYYPVLTVTVKNKNGGALFSYSVQAGKQAAMQADVAKRRAYGALAAALERNFIEEFYAGLGFSPES
ncbi:MAG: hypothetical protein LBD07_01670 [Spirochaetaceae bacterium]|jgi:hypothetical protein|nr:hypothetical protein [Spirochaetaceae bacterium]